MLFKTALKNLKKSPVMNITCFVQLTAVFLVAAVMVSTMSVRYQTYTPLKKYLSERGILAFYNSFYFGAIKPGGDPNIDAIFSTNDLCGYMNAKSATAIRLHTMTLQGFRETAATFIYEDEMLQNWYPGIERGRWLSNDADELEIVISEGAYGLDVGDEAVFSLWQYHQSDISVRAKVVGVLREDANILGERGYGEGGVSYRNLYCPLYNHSINTYAFCMSESVLKKLYPSAYELPMQAVFYTYSDDVPDTVIEEAMKTAASMNAGEILRLELINKNSKAYLRDELMKLLPIVIILLILTTISSISASAISTRRRLRDYAKYYVIGLRWQQCALVNFFQALAVGAAALLISCVGLFVIGETALSETFFVVWNVPLFLTLLGIFAFHLVFSMIMPLIMLNSATPKQLLTTE